MHNSYKHFHPRSVARNLGGASEKMTSHKISYCEVVEVFIVWLVMCVIALLHQRRGWPGNVKAQNASLASAGLPRGEIKVRMLHFDD